MQVIDMKSKKDSRANVMLPSDLHKELSHYAIDADLSLYEVVARGLAALKRHGTKGIDENTTGAVNSGDSAPEGSELPWVKRLLSVLRSENEILIRAIQQNLIALNLIADRLGGDAAAAGAGKSNLPPQVTGAMHGAARVDEDARIADEEADRVKEKHRGDRKSPGGNRKRAG